MTQTKAKKSTAKKPSMSELVSDDAQVAAPVIEESKIEAPSQQAAKPETIKVVNGYAETGFDGVTVKASNLALFQRFQKEQLDKEPKFDFKVPARPGGSKTEPFDVALNTVVYRMKRGATVKLPYSLHQIAVNAGGLA